MIPKLAKHIQTVLKSENHCMLRAKLPPLDSVFRKEVKYHYVLLVNLLLLNRVSGKNVTFHDDHLENKKIVHLSFFIFKLFNQWWGDFQFC